MCKPRSEQANTGVGGVKACSPTLPFLLLFDHLFIAKTFLFLTLFALDIQDETRREENRSVSLLIFVSYCSAFLVTFKPKFKVSGPAAIKQL